MGIGTEPRIWGMADGTFWVGELVDVRDGRGWFTRVSAKVPSLREAAHVYIRLLHDPGMPADEAAEILARDESEWFGWLGKMKSFPASHVRLRLSDRECGCVFPSDLCREAWLLEEVRVDGLTQRQIANGDAESREKRVIAKGLTYPEAMTKATCYSSTEPGNCIVRTPDLFQLEWDLQNHDEDCDFYPGWIC